MIGPELFAGNLLGIPDSLCVSEIREHRGVIYSVPSTNTGIWHYKIHPGHLRADSLRPGTAPIAGYPTREAAMKAARDAIDVWVGRPVY